MSARIPVQLSQNPYDIVVGYETLGKTGHFASQVVRPGKCALITDSNVAPFFGDTVERSLTHADFSVTRIVIPAGEESKSMNRAAEVCDQMIEAGLDRGSSVVALGGGVVGDLAGFAASIFFRGIPVIQVPTTVVAQVDSAIGGKTGVNSRLGKNLIGAFRQPAMVIADPATLKTLPKREFNEGFAEVIKHAAIADPELLDDISDFSFHELPAIIARNVKIKARIVAEDEFETQGLRALLNFGHTIGHAIENIAGYGRYLHGEAISLGLAAALYLSEKKAGLAPEASALVLKALQDFELPTRLPDDLPTDALMQALSRDKKFEDGAIRFVLVPELGQAFVSKDITADDLREAIEKIRG